MKYSFCYTIKNRTHYINTFNGVDYEINNFHKSIESIKNSFDNEDDYEVIVTDYKSTDTDYSWLRESVKNCKIVTIDSEFFNRGKGLNVGSKYCKNDIIFFIDSDMLISKELIKQSNEILENKEVFFPICYSYTTPQNDVGRWRPTGFGNVIIKRDFYVNGDLKWNERESWGLEDSDFFSMVEKDSHRENGIGFYHQWHSDDSSFKMANYKYKNRRYDGRIT